MTHPSLPPRVAVPWIVGAAAIWLVVAAVGIHPARPLDPGPFQGHVTLLSDVYAGDYGQWALGRVREDVVLVEMDTEASRGDRVEVKGSLSGEPGFASGRPYGGVLDVRVVEGVDRSRFWPHMAGRIVRQRVLDSLTPFDPGRGLLAGFLIGDTSRIPDSSVEDMRRSGLSHFVAVSGSNVVLWLGFLFVVAGPLALGPRRRAVVGLAGLPVYVAATGFEPSVLRASAMAAIVLAGRLLGIVLEAWQLLAFAVAVLVVVDPVLTGNAGFQLSVAATGGVLMGARWPVAGSVGRALAITIGAQLAVAPLLLLHFGSVPLMSAVVNLLAAPLVTTATVLAGVGVAGLSPLIPVADVLAELVLWLADGASELPQIVGWQLTVLLVVGLAANHFPSIRVPLIVGVCLVVLAAILWPAPRLPPGSVVVLDVGQGDAILIHGGEGRYALVDGGPDPRVLRERLRSYGVTRFDLVVMTHVHADHVTGLAGIVGEYPIGEVWAAPAPHETRTSTEFFEVLDVYGVSVKQPEVGAIYRLGDLELVVEGPTRRYKSPNDASIVITVSGQARSMLLSGDIETFAQDDLDHLVADVLKVPHQGAGTSDPDWLATVGASLAVISVGPNQFGHPVDWVIDTLGAGGADVRRTDLDGDVMVDLMVAG